jgi:hypothetical protein
LILERRKPARTGDESRHAQACRVAGNDSIVMDAA